MRRRGGRRLRVKSVTWGRPTQGGENSGRKVMITRVRTVVARYLLGVRERNIRVVYLRPYLHSEGNLTPEAANVEMVREIADGIRASGMRLGRATPFRPFGANFVLIALVFLQSQDSLTLMAGLTGFQSRYNLDIPVVMAGLSIATLPIFALYIFGQRFFMRGLVAGAIKGG